MNQQPFFDIFRTGKQEMEKVIAAGLSAGGDWCDLYFEYSVYNDLMLRDGEVNSGGYHEDFGVGIRVLDGERTGYAYSESTELKDMIAAASAARVSPLIPVGVKLRTSQGYASSATLILPWRVAITSGCREM